MNKLEELRAEGIIFYPEEGWDVGIMINMNDTFGWACADGEEITEAEVDEVYAAYFDAPEGTGVHAVTRWVCARRGEEPFDLWKEKYGWPEPKMKGGVP
jgi:hypothetical protein